MRFRLVVDLQIGYIARVVPDSTLVGRSAILLCCRSNARFAMRNAFVDSVPPNQATVNQSRKRTLRTFKSFRGMITRIAVVLLALRWFICVGAFAQGLTPLPTLPPNPWAKPPGGVPTANQGDSSGAGQRRSSIKAMLANRQNGAVQGPGESGQVPAGDRQDASGSEPPVPANQPNSANPASPANPAHPANPDSAAISSEAVQAQLQQLQSATDLDPNLKSSLTLTYEATLAEIKKRFEEEKAIKEYTAALEAATVATADAKKRKEKPDFKSPYIEGSLTWSSPEYLQSLQLQIGALLQGATKNRTDT